jgi:hypothetical protein
LCRVRLNGPTIRPDQVELNGSCRARPTGCRPGLSTVRLVLRARPSPLPVVPSCTRVGPNHTDHRSTHLRRAKFSGLVASSFIAAIPSRQATVVALSTAAVAASVSYYLRQSDPSAATLQPDIAFIHTTSCFFSTGYGSARTA